MQSASKLSNTNKGEIKSGHLSSDVTLRLNGLKVCAPVYLCQRHRFKRPDITQASLSVCVFISIYMHADYLVTRHVGSPHSVPWLESTSLCLKFAQTTPTTTLLAMQASMLKVWRVHVTSVRTASAVPTVVWLANSLILVQAQRRENGRELCRWLPEVIGFT